MVQGKYISTLARSEKISQSTKNFSQGFDLVNMLIKNQLKLQFQCHIADLGPILVEK